MRMERVLFPSLAMMLGPPGGSARRATKHWAIPAESLRTGASLRLSAFGRLPSTQLLASAGRFLSSMRSQAQCLSIVPEHLEKPLATYRQRYAREDQFDRDIHRPEQS